MNKLKFEENRLIKKYQDVLLNNPTSEDFAEAYDELHRLYILRKNRKCYRDELSFPAKLVLEIYPKNKKILEIGCGNGFTAIELSKKGYDVTAIDISKVLLDIAKARIPQNLENKPTILFSDARKLDFADNTFDIVISSSLIEHFTREDALKHLREVKRVLNYKGCYVFYCGNRLYAGYRVGGYHLYMYNTKEQLDLVKEEGFKVEFFDGFIFRFYRNLLSYDSVYLKIVNIYERIFEFFRLNKLLSKNMKLKLLRFIIVFAYKDT